MTLEFLWQSDFLLPMFQCILVGHLYCIVCFVYFHWASLRFHRGYSQPWRVQFHLASLNYFRGYSGPWNALSVIGFEDEVILFLGALFFFDKVFNVLEFAI